MTDQLLLFDAPAAGLKLAVCTAAQLSRDAARRHELASGSAAVLAQGLAGALLLAATDRPEDPKHARVDLQLDCPGPLKSLLVDATGRGSVRGLVKVGRLDRAGGREEPARAPAPGAAAVPAGEGAHAAPGMQFAPQPGPAPLARFSARGLLAAADDQQAGLLSILRAVPGADGRDELRRAVVAFAGADLAAGLSAWLRADRRLAGELALDVLYRRGEPLAAVGGVLVLCGDEEGRDAARAMGEVLRVGAFAEALEAAEAVAPGNAHALAQELGGRLSLGPLRLLGEVRPRFACRCSRDRVIGALATLGKAELREMAGKDGGAEATCDFCAAVYRVSAQELLELAGSPP